MWEWPRPLNDDISSKPLKLTQKCDNPLNKCSISIKVHKQDGVKNGQEAWVRRCFRLLQIAGYCPWPHYISVLLLLCCSAWLLPARFFKVFANILLWGQFFFWKLLSLVISTRVSDFFPFRKLLYSFTICDCRLIFSTSTEVPAD